MIEVMLTGLCVVVVAGAVALIGGRRPKRDAPQLDLDVVFHRYSDRE